jgi:GNAT superfamily N-acetyltransferase
VSLPLRRVGAQDRHWHAAYCEGVRAVFRRADFERWIAWGEWNEDYRAYCLIEGERIVANAALTRMRLVVADEPLDAFQIGAVYCLPEHRGQGLARRVLDAALQHCGDAPVLLFGNPDVRDFYSRFGFSAREEQVFVVEHSCKPAGEPAPVLDPGDPAVRARIHALAAQGLPESQAFGARGHGRILTWYCANGFARPLRELAPDLLVVADVEGDTLYIDAVLSTSQQALAPLLPRLIDRPIRHIRFGFTPDRWWPGAQVVEIDTDSDLFLRGFDPSPPAPHRFPLLART